VGDFAEFKRLLLYILGDHADLLGTLNRMARFEGSRGIADSVAITFRSMKISSNTKFDRAIARSPG